MNHHKQNHPPHTKYARPCNQRMGIRGLVSIACAILPANCGPNPARNTLSAHYLIEGFSHMFTPLLIVCINKAIVDPIKKIT